MWAPPERRAPVGTTALALALIVGAWLLSGCTGAQPTIAPLTTTAGAEETTSDPGPGSAAPETTTPGDVSDTVPLLQGELSITIIDTHPHDPEAFTQGLEVHDGRFIEGTGLYGESDRRIVDIETGTPILVEPLSPDLFGEGLTIVGNEIIQLTWKAGVYIRSDLETLAEVDRGTYDGEGWGLCHDGEQLIMSDGTATIDLRDPTSFELLDSVEVTLDGEPVERLNELECVNGQVLANVWLTDLIVVIDPGSGEVVATLDGSVLRPDGFPLETSSFALNGIAHDEATGHYYLTGKLWPVLYEVELSSP